MKYLMHWGLSDPPFEKNISCRNLTMTEDLKQGIQCLSSIKERGGFAVLSGKPGIGKTTILRKFVNDLPNGLFKVVYLNYTTVNGAEFFRSLASSLGVEPATKRLVNYTNIKDRIKDLRIRDRVMPIIVVDEAQYLGKDILLDVPLLMNFEMDSRDYAGLLLCGTPLLNSRLNMAQFDALRDRIGHFYEVTGMNRGEARAFVYDRMKLAGGDGHVFLDAAIDMAYEASNGSIRRLSNILNYALMLGCSSGKKEIASDIIKQAIEEDAM